MKTLLKSFRQLFIAQPSQNSQLQFTPETEGSMDSLLLKAGGDRNLIERFIFYELKCCPGLPWSEAASRANYRWERDLNR